MLPPVPESKVVEGQQRLTTLTVLLSARRETVEDWELAKDGLLMVTDDASGTVWRVAYTRKK